MARKDIATYNRQVSAALTKIGLDDAAQFVNRMANLNTEEQRDEAIDELARKRKAAPYPFCRTPDKCVGKGYCPQEFACND